MDSKIILSRVDLVHPPADRPSQQRQFRMSYENHRVTAAKSLFILLLLAIPAVAIAQFDLLGDGTQGGEKEHATWEITLKSAEIPAGGRGEIVASYETVKDWYVYAPSHPATTGLPTSIKVSFKGSGEGGAKLDKEPLYPPPKVKEIKLFDEPEIHHTLEGGGAIRQGFVVPADAPEGKLEIEVTLTYMACSDLLCDPKATVKKALVAMIGPPIEGEQATASAPPTEPDGEGLLAFILAMIGGGLFALVMPCTYPMIPITIAFFTKQAEARNGKVLPLALCYGLGIIACFNVIGLLVGDIIIRFAQNWLLNLGFGIVFLIFALSFFNLFTIRLPSGLNNLASKVSGRSGLLGVFLLGATLVITSFTCTAPVMGGLLALTATAEGGSTGKILLGMSVFGLTMATPFFFLALFPAWTKSMPRSGEWMNKVKVFLGFLEVAAALKFFSNADVALNNDDLILNQELFFLAWAAIFTVAGLYLVSGFKGVSLRSLAASISVLALSAYFLICSRPGIELDFITAALAPPPAAASPDNLSTDTVKYDHNDRLAFARRLNELARAGKPLAQTEVDGLFGIVFPRGLVKDDPKLGMSLAKAEDKLALVNFTGFT